MVAVQCLNKKGAKMSRIISIRDDLYDLLDQIKGEDKSFSGAIDSILADKRIAEETNSRLEGQINEMLKRRRQHKRLE